MTRARAVRLVRKLEALAADRAASTAEKERARERIAELVEQFDVRRDAGRPRHTVRIGRVGIKL